MSGPGTVPGLRTTESCFLTGIPMRLFSRQAWALILGLALTQGIAFGVTLNSFGVFTLPMMEAFHGSHEQVARVATIFLITMTLFMPVAGWLLDRVSPRLVMTAGAAITGLSFLLAAKANDLATYTTIMAFSGVGVGLSIYVTAVTLISRWIPFQRQGLALGIMFSGISAVGIAFPVSPTGT